MILALDLSGTVGWAAGGRESGDVPFAGSFALPKVGGEGARFVAAADAIADLLERFGIKFLIAEAPLSLYAATKPDVVNQQRGLRAIAIAEAWRANCAYSEVSADTYRRAVLNLPPKTTRDRAKAAAIRYCEANGWHVPNHDAAEAVCILEWGRRARQ